MRWPFPDDWLWWLRLGGVLLLLVSGTLLFHRQQATPGTVVAMNRSITLSGRRPTTRNRDGRWVLAVLPSEAGQAQWRVKERLDTDQGGSARVVWSEGIQLDLEPGASVEFWEYRRRATGDGHTVQARFELREGQIIVTVPSQLAPETEVVVEQPAQPPVVVRPGQMITFIATSQQP